jgi:hypothetical protein
VAVQEEGKVYGASPDERIAIGLITRRLDNPATLLDFLNNARQCGHHIDRLIVAYSHGVDEKAVRILKREIDVDVLCAHGDARLKNRLLVAGMEPDEVKDLLNVPSWGEHREVPYGAYRNTVLTQALVDGVDYLLFVDSDMEPRVLTAYVEGQSTWQEVDFVSSHLDYLTMPDVAATTSDYSGYYIIPPMGFEGLKALLSGLRKDMAYAYMAACEEHGCLNFGPETPDPPIPTDKVLGGNLGLSLDRPRRLAPFFSTTYAINGRCILGRGEDTLLGQAVHAGQGLALDIDLRIFHDTYDDFPRAPDPCRQEIRNRFHRACLGWIGRNPFLTWFLESTGRLGTNFETAIARQREGLSVGGPCAARALGDERFECLPSALDASLAKLPETIERYERLMNGWAALLDALGWVSEGTPVGEEGSQLPSVA